MPVLVGVGQVRGNRERSVSGAREPLELLVDAVRGAATDSKAGDDLVAAADSVAVVKVVSWAYDDLAARLAARVGATPASTVNTTLSGQWPARLLDRAAARIADGTSRVALIGAAEAMASLTALGKAGVDPVAHGWSAEPGGPPTFDPEDLGSPAMQAAGMVLPTRVYPLFESALRHASGTSPGVSAADSAELYAAFSQVAVGNDAAWNPQARTAAEIGAVGPGNRMVCEPYPLAVNAMPMVDQAAAVLVTSLATARAHGVPEERIVHVWGGAGADDAVDFLERPSLARSAALADTLDRCLAAGGMRAADLDVVDVYSCFPVVPKLVAAHLGLPLAALAGVTGGHNAFGGPLAGYSLHATVAAVHRLRAGAGSAQRALVHANGGWLTYQHAVLLGREPHPAGYIGDPEPRAAAAASPPALVPVPASADVTVEAATVEHSRAGEPAVGYLVARTAAGARFAGRTAPDDVASARALSLWRHGPEATEIVGTRVRIHSHPPNITVEPAP